LNLLAFPQAELTKSSGDLSSEASLGAMTFLPGDIAKDFADFLFHAAAMAPGSALQLSFDGLFEITDEKLGHGTSHKNDIMISRFYGK
jgi:hypothetical protein